MPTTVTKPPASRCPSCGEDWPGLVSKETGLCRNCAVLQGLSHEPHRGFLDHCSLCGGTHVPAQEHHLAGKRNTRFLVVRICLNCHSIATDRQCREWDSRWNTGTHPSPFIVQGLYDVWWIWWQRSGCRWWRQQLSELVHLVWMAALALAQLWGLRGWEVLA